MSFRVLTINIAGTNYNWFESRRDLLVQQIRNLSPDAVCLQESHYLPDKKYDQTHDLAHRTGLDNFIFAPYGNTFEYELEKLGGIGIISRFPFQEVQIRKLPQGKELLGARVMLVATISEKNLTLANTHLSWRRDEVDVRLEQVKEIHLQLSKYENVILAGDFNAYSPEPVIETIQRHYQDTYALVNPGDEGYTWSKRNQLIQTGRPEGRIDYIFTSPTLTPVQSKVVLDGQGEQFISDHFGVLTDVSL